MSSPSAPADPSRLLAVAREAAGSQQYPAPALYVVATPIGNLADLSLRAIHVLALADAIACEDTRHTAPLLRHLGLDGGTKALIAAHRHNEREAADAVLARLARGERVACVSDAGTPALSDPGALLVAAARDAGYRTIPIPGASSALAALSVAGDAAAAASDAPASFTFAGFLPSRAGERATALARLAARRETQLLFEAPHRIEMLAQGLAAACADRLVTLCRELTKQFETVATMPCAALPAWLAADPNRLRGEFVLVLHAVAGDDPADADEARHDAMLRTLLDELPLKQAVSIAARLTGGARNGLYARALVLKQAAHHDG